MNYQQKYLKYKLKYLKLQKIKYGGNIIPIAFQDNIVDKISLWNILCNINQKKFRNTLTNFVNKYNKKQNNENLIFLLNCINNFKNFDKIMIKKLINENNNQCKKLIIDFIVLFLYSLESLKKEIINKEIKEKINNSIYKIVNNSLRDTNGIINQNTELPNYICRLNSILNDKFHQTQKNIKCFYRGLIVCKNNKNLKNNNYYKYFYIPSFMSTSSSENKTNFFSTSLLKKKCMKEIKKHFVSIVLKINNNENLKIKPVSLNKTSAISESEFLFPSNCIWKVISCKKNNNIQEFDQFIFKINYVGQFNINHNLNERKQFIQTFSTENADIFLNQCKDSPFGSLKECWQLKNNACDNIEIKIDNQLKIFKCLNSEDFDDFNQQNCNTLDNNNIKELKEKLENNKTDDKTNNDKANNKTNNNKEDDKTNDKTDDKTDNDNPDSKSCIIL